MFSSKARLIAAVSCLGCLGAPAAAVAGQPDASIPGIQLTHGGGFGWHRRGHDRPFARLCDQQTREDWIDGRLDLISSFTDFNPEQAEAWTRLTEAVRAASNRVGVACAEEATAGGLQSTPARLARAERLMATGLAVVQELRPPFEAFYATLDDDQRAALDRLSERWRHR